MNRGALTGCILCCCFVSALLFSGFVIAVHGDHDCCGEECPLCLLVQGTLNFSRQLRQIPVFFVFPPNILFLIPLSAGFFAFYAVPASSVRLKVKINR
ncbi:MAG: hypothetical protein LBG07_00765 [Treponema sp.]|jgi:hypothetical protein|nr:hypothetical protein [Treponema sp.]